MNQAGQRVLDGIIRNPSSHVRGGVNRFGGKDVIAPDGRGARFDAGGTFRGFLEPRIMKGGDIEIQVCSDVDYERLIVELYLGGKYVCLISQEQGVQNLLIELPESVMDTSDRGLKYDLAKFLEGIRLAKNELEKDVH
jgi:hypothetical protein